MMERHQLVQIRVSPAEKAEWSRLAEGEHLSLSEWIRKGLNKNRGRRIPAEAIAKEADEGKDISGHFTNDGVMVTAPPITEGDKEAAQRVLLAHPEYREVKISPASGSGHSNKKVVSTKPAQKDFSQMTNSERARYFSELKAKP